MRRLLPLLTPLLALDLAGPAHAATTWRVSTGGVDSGAYGSSGSPCRHIGTAVTKAASGDTSQVGPGEFAETVDSATVLTIQGAGAGTVAGYSAASDTVIDRTTGGLGIRGCGPGATGSCSRRATPAATGPGR